MEPIDEATRKKIRRRFHGKPDIRIGQKGLHESLVSTARELIEQRGGIIKIKVLRNIASSRSDVEKLVWELAEKIGANFVKVIGRSAVVADLRLICRARSKGEISKQRILPRMRTQ